MEKTNCFLKQRTRFKFKQLQRNSIFSLIGSRDSASNRKIDLLFIYWGTEAPSRKRDQAVHLSRSWWGRMNLPEATPHQTWPTAHNTREGHNAAHLPQGQTICEFMQIINCPHLKKGNKTSFNKFNIRCLMMVQIRGFMEHEASLVNMTNEKIQDSYRAFCSTLLDISHLMWLKQLCLYSFNS